MTERDSDIEFDFFDEPETEEATERHRLPRRPNGGGGPRRPRRRNVHPPTGLIPILRLAGLVAFLILAVTLLVVGLKGCQSSSKHDAYASYMRSVQGIAARSEQVGRELNQRLITPGIKEADLESAISGLAAQEQQEADQAQSLKPPGPLRLAHAHMIEALQLRASGLGRLRDAFHRTATMRNPTQAGQLLAQQAQLLVASDVDWDFYFKEAATRVLREQNVTGVAVPDSNFLGNIDLASSRGLQPVWQRLHGAATGGTSTVAGGKHGDSLVSVTALPDGKQLTAGTQTSITASTDLGFKVAVQDSGDFQEVQVPVTLTIQATGKPIVKRTTIPVINPGETKTVTFGDFSQLPFGSPTQLKVEVQPVAGETNTSNNAGTFPVIFSLG